jgi:hypothetical protein
LHKVYIYCTIFKGKDNNGINQLFRDSLHEIYDMLFDIDAEVIDILEDFYTAIANATDAAGERHTPEMAPHSLLYSTSSNTTDKLRCRQPICVRGMARNTDPEGHYDPVGS